MVDGFVKQTIMKTIYASFIAIILCVGSVFSQAPQYINYQAVIRDATNYVIPNQVVGIKISILKGSFSGPVV